MKFNIGEVVSLTEDVHTTTAITKTPVTIYKGSEGIIVADKENPSVLFRNGQYIRLPSNSELSSEIDAYGLAKWLLYRLDDEFDIIDKLEEYADFKNLAKASQALYDNLLNTLFDVGITGGRDV